MCANHVGLGWVRFHLTQPLAWVLPLLGVLSAAGPLSATTPQPFVHAVGSDADGQVDGRTLLPRAALSGNVTAVAAGKPHNLAIKSDRTVWARGYNQYGQPGDGTTDDQATSEGLTRGRAGGRTNNRLFHRDSRSLPGGTKDVY